MTAPTNRLPMAVFLAAVAEHRTRAREVLIGDGHHPAVVLAKAKTAARRGYTDFGVVPDRCWLTPEGTAYLEGASDGR